MCVSYKSNQLSINRPGLVGSLLYFRCRQLGRAVEDICLKAIPPSPGTQVGVRAFIDRVCVLRK